MLAHQSTFTPGIPVLFCLPRFFFVACTLAATPAWAGQALVDFGRAGTATTGYNNVSAINLDVPLNDTTAAATGWTIRLANSGTGGAPAFGGAGAAADVPAATVAFPPNIGAFAGTAIRDSLFFNNGSTTIATVASATITITGLNPGLGYDLLFYGSRLNGQGITQNWNLITGGSNPPAATVTHNSLDNRTVEVNWPAVLPDPTGKIVITASGTVPVGGFQALALNFGSITEGPPPPVSSPVLVRGLPPITSVLTGLDATLSVLAAQGIFPVPSYKWEYDNLPINGVYTEVGIDPTFTITAADPALHNGNYRLTLLNNAGSVDTITSFTVDPDVDGDGIPGPYETNTGIFVSATDTGTKPTVADSDTDGLLDGEEITIHRSNPNLIDTDGDSLSDGLEVNTLGTSPILADTDADGLPDNIETNTGVFTSVTDTGTNPLINGDADADGFNDTYEVQNGPTSPFDPAVPGGPNPSGFAVAFDALAGNAGGPNVLFGPLVYAGLPAIAQKNWNRTGDAPAAAGPQAGSILNVATPSPAQLVNSAGIVIGDGTTGVTLDYTAGNGTFSSVTDRLRPYGRLFNSFIYGAIASNPDATVTLGNIPYAKYDAYVYFGSETNNRFGTLTSTSAATAYSFRTAVASNGAAANFVPTTNTAPASATSTQANYAVFKDQTSPTFDVKTTVGAGQTTLGIYGVQIVEVTTLSYATWSTANAGGQAPDLDFDRDGMANGVEFFMGATGSAFTPNPPLVGNTITWPKSPSANATYLIQTSTTLTAETPPAAGSPPPPASWIPERPSSSPCPPPCPGNMSG